MFRLCLSLDQSHVPCQWNFFQPLISRVEFLNRNMSKYMHRRLFNGFITDTIQQPKKWELYLLANGKVAWLKSLHIILQKTNWELGQITCLVRWPMRSRLTIIKDVRLFPSCTLMTKRVVTPKVKTSATPMRRDPCVDLTCLWWCRSPIWLLIFCTILCRASAMPDFWSQGSKIGHPLQCLAVGIVSENVSCYLSPTERPW